METNGEGIWRAFRSLRKVNESIALLLGTAEGVLAKDGWEPLFKNKCSSDTSDLILTPNRWAPWYFFRFAVNKKHLGLLSFVSVILDRPDEDVVTEPLISAGLLQFAGQEVKSEEVNYWYAEMHLWMPGRRDDGTFVYAQGKKLPEDCGAGLLKVASMARPLVQITDSRKLAESVVEPLLSEVERFIGQPERRQGGIPGRAER